MFRDIPESDWRHFKRVHEALHERFCQRALDELAGVVHSSAGSAFDRYQRACDLLRNRNQELARAFDDFRRSTAVR